MNAALSPSYLPESATAICSIPLSFPDCIALGSACLNGASLIIESSGTNLFLAEPISAPAAQPLFDTLPTRRSLLSRLRNIDDNESWRSFFEMYWRLLYNVARKSGLSDHHAQDIVQETVIAVARKMPEFRYDPARGGFKQWLLLICRRRIQDHFRRIYSVSGSLEQSFDEDTARFSENLPDPLLAPDAQIDEIWEEEWRESVFRAALARVRQRVSPKHYQVFDCCVLQNQRPAAVARMLGMSAAHVYLAKHRVSAAVKQAVKELKSEMERERAAA